MSGSLRVPHPLPYQGSKRWLADTICRCLPDGVGTFYEPFAGSAAVTLAVCSDRLAQNVVLSDIHEPLVALWLEIVHRPEELSDAYEALWKAQRGRERAYYDEVRRRFNQRPEPALFLYLLARCVKAAIRYNSRGEFNNSPDNRRLGARPDTMRRHILRASRLLRGTSRIRCCDFREATSSAAAGDVIYMDPPYQGVTKDRDARYVQGLSFDDFHAALRDMNRRGLSFLVSYDGRTGDRRYGRALPNDLNLLHFEVEAGRSTQETLLGRSSVTYESIYLSPALVKRLHRLPFGRQAGLAAKRQLQLFESA